LLNVGEPAECLAATPPSSPCSPRRDAMRINPLPFVFAPGVVLAGYLVAGGHGALLAALAWTAIVTAGTLCAWLMHR
jgi:hypothetical protein